MKDMGYIYNKRIKSDPRLENFLNYLIKTLREHDITAVILWSVWLSLVMRCVVNGMLGVKKLTEIRHQKEITKKDDETVKSKNGESDKQKPTKTTNSENKSKDSKKKKD